VAEAARLLVSAQNPLIVADRAARTPAGIARLVELAETLQASVIAQRGRMNFPSRHPLNQTDSGRQLVANADVILGLELTDFWGTVSAFRDSLHRSSRRLLPFAGFSIYVRRPANQMPPYTEKVVSDTDLAHVYAFLQSRLAPPLVESIPLLQK
jgi:hypothetical protein